MDKVIDRYKNWRKKYCLDKEIVEVIETDKEFIVKKIDNWKVSYNIK